MKGLSLYQRLKQPEDPVFSVEFFPPKSDTAAAQLLETADQLRHCTPDFASITYGAGGSTRDRTIEYARILKEDYGYTIMPHLTCVGHSRDELRQIITEYKEAGLSSIMALRGDPPAGKSNFIPHPNGLRHANELVELIRETHPECSIGVAGYPEKHPEAASDQDDLKNLKQKVDAGASFITTQLFFDNNVYFDFINKSRSIGIDVPILPGLLSVNSLQQAQRFCEMCQTTLPDSLEASLRSAGDDTVSLQRAGQEWTIRQAKELLDQGAPGLHLYILNQSETALKLMEELKSCGYYSGKS